MTITEFSTEQLRSEIERREKEAQPPVPQTLDSMNWQPVVNLCKQYIFELSDRSYVDEDLPHYIFESAMESVYGKNVWEYINAKR